MSSVPPSTTPGVSEIFREARVTLRGSGRIESLNVSVAAGILIWALKR